MSEHYVPPNPTVHAPGVPFEEGDRLWTESLQSATMELMHRMRRRMVQWLFLAGMVFMGFSVLFSWMVFLFWSCESRTSFQGKCKKKRKAYVFLAAIGLFVGPAHRCPIALVDSPWSVKLPDWKRNASSVDLKLNYVVEKNLANGGKELPMNLLFGGHQTFHQREESFNFEPHKNIHCGFAQVDGPELISRKDQEYVGHCRFLVATCIFDNYDQPHQPSNVSLLTHKMFCFIMLADHVSVKTFKEGKLLKRDENGDNWVGMWRVLEMKSLPYDEARRNGKVPKLLLHRLFPKTQYSIWIDGKLELLTDPILIIERYLWRENQSFAIAQHKQHRSVYEEADACKRRKRYARPLIDQHMEVYRREGLQPWSEAKLPLLSDVPEGGLIVREHTPMTNLFSCLWFNEVNRFTPRDQLSFGYVLHKLRYKFPFFMFPNCEYNTLVALHKHVREHSSKLEWVKRMDDIRKLSKYEGSADKFGT